MAWRKCLEQIEKEYPFFPLILANTHGSTHNDQKFRLPDPIILSSAIINRTIPLRGTKITISFPYLDDAAKWLTITTSLKLMREDYYTNKENSQNFIPGQKLILNGCVVEYVGEKVDSQYGFRIEYKCISDSKDPYTGKRGLITCVQPIEKVKFQSTKGNKPLSRDSQVESSIQALKDNINVLDKILNIRSYGNKTFFKRSVALVTQIGGIQRFLNKNQIDGGDIRNMMHWGKLDDEGRIKTIGNENVSSISSCVVSQNLVSLLAYLQNNQIEALIIDGAKKAVDEIQALNEIIDKKINIYIVVDRNDDVNLDYLGGLNFKRWSWEREQLKEIYDNYAPVESSPFTPFELSISHYINRSIKMELVEDSLVDNLIVLMLDLYKKISNDDVEMVIVKNKLVGIINEISRFVREPDHVWKEHATKVIEYVNEKLKQRYSWLDKDTQAGLDLVLNGIRDFSIYPKQHLPKMSKLSEKLQSLNAETNPRKIYVIVNGHKEIQPTKDYIVSRIDQDKKHEITCGTLEDYILNIDRQEHVEVVVCGWLTVEKITRLLKSYRANSLTFLLYKNEQQWLQKSMRFMEEIKPKNIDKEYFYSILSVPKDELSSSNTVSGGMPDQHGKYDIFELEFDFKKTLISRFTAIAHGKRKISARFITFVNSKFSFITQNHSIYRANKLLQSDSTDTALETVKLNDLSEGDYIIFRESERDVIKEIAEKGLEKAGKREIIITANLWKDSLKSAYGQDLNDFAELYRRLKEAGCVKHPTTIRTWLFDDNLIGPSDEYDLHIIAKACPYNDFEDKVNDVIEAIDLLRKAHNQAADYLKKIFLSKIPEAIRNKKDTSIEEISIDTDGSGLIHLIRIEEIGSDMEVDSSSINKLLSKET